MATNMVPLVTKTFQARASDSANCRTINMYMETMPAPESKEQAVLIGTPGIKLFKDLDISAPTATCRGVYYTSTGRTFAVYGQDLYEIKPNKTYTHISSIAALSTRVFFRDDGTRMLMVDGATALSYNLTTDTFDPAVVIPDTTTPSSLQYLGKRMILLDGTADYRWSNVNDPLTWDALSVDDADTFPDILVGSEVVRDELWLFGPRSFEVRRLTDNPDYPFQLVGGSAGEIGCGAGNSICKIGETVFWLGSSAAGEGIVYMSDGYAAQRISDHALEYQIGQLSSTRDAIGWAYQEEGHVFYVLTFVQGDRTFVYDMTVGAWHERASRDPLLNILHKWSPIYAVHTGVGTILGSQAGPYVLQLDLDYYSEYFSRTYPSVPVVRMHQTPIYWANLQTVCIDEMAIDMACGVGTTAGQGLDPKVMLQLSKDGGHTWGSEHWKSIGKVGEYGKRVAFRTLGRARALVVRIMVSDPVRVQILGGRLSTSVMGSAR